MQAIPPLAGDVILTSDVTLRNEAYFVSDITHGGVTGENRITVHNPASFKCRTALRQPNPRFSPCFLKYPLPFHFCVVIILQKFLRTSTKHFELCGSDQPQALKS